VPNILAINEASRYDRYFYDVKEIDMKDKVMSILEKGYVLKTRELKTTERMIEYRFLSPWLALNQANYESL